MRIVVQGDNRIASDLAVNLSREGTDVALVGTDPVMQKDIGNRHEIHCILGSAAVPRTIKELQLGPDCMFITVTDDDALNLLSCQLAKRHKAGKTLCKLRDSTLTEEVSCNKESYGVDEVFRPEHLVEEQLEHLIEHPGAFQLVELHEGKVRVVGVKALAGGPLVGKEISEIRRLLPRMTARIVSIYTEEGTRPVAGETVISEGDDVFFIVAMGNEDEVIRTLHSREPQNKRIMIAGGGNIGMELAERLQENYRVKLLERDLKRCDYLSRTLDDVIVLHGTPSDRELLTSEYISEIDVFCAITNDDETNYLSAMLAKKLGAHHVISLINETAYLELVEGRDIDIVLVPSLISLGALLGQVRRGVNEARRLRRGAAEVVSLQAADRIQGKKLRDLDMPTGTSIGAVVRDGEVIIAYGDLALEPDDSLVTFLTDSTHLSALVKQFT